MKNKVKLKQKFLRGDIVKIADDLGPSMWHFRSGCQAVVLGSYMDLCHGNANDCKDFSVLFLDTGRSCSWYHEWQLTFVKHWSERQLKTFQSKFED